jgi:hypothetical protein
VNIIHVPLIVGIVSNEVFPIVPLPDTPLAGGFANRGTPFGFL